MTSLTPYLILRGEISAAGAGLVLLLYLVGSSLLQPLFGLLADRSSRRIFVIVGPVWISIMAGCFGWVSSTGALLALAALGGVGTAAFHPQAASMVNRLSQANKGFTVGIFATGGNIGFALGPVAAAGVGVAGLHWSILATVLGLLLAVLLVLFVPDRLPPQTQVASGGLRLAAMKNGKALGLVVAVIALRSGLQYALIIFLPLYFFARGLPAELGSYCAFVLSISGALGGLVGGTLSARYGRKRVVVASHTVAAPLLVAALLAPSPWVWPLLAISGAALLASNSATVVQGQELLPGSTGVASGLTLGFAFGLSGLIAEALGILSDHIGVTPTILMVPMLALIAGGLGALTPETGQSSQTSALTGAETGAVHAG